MTTLLANNGRDKLTVSKAYLTLLGDCHNVRMSLYE